MTPVVLLAAETDKWRNGVGGVVERGAHEALMIVDDVFADELHLGNTQDGSGWRMKFAIDSAL